MIIRTIVIRTNEEAVIGLHNDENYFEEVQEYVEGYVEMYKLYDNYYVLCNEEGKLKNLPFNICLFDELHKLLTSFVGNIIIVKLSNDGERFESIDEDFAKFLVNDINENNNISLKRIKIYFEGGE